MFEQQQKAYILLQGVLLGQGEHAAGWALGVAAEAKGRALAYRFESSTDSLTARQGAARILQAEVRRAISKRLPVGPRPYEDMCEALWAEVQRRMRRGL